MTMEIMHFDDFPVQSRRTEPVEPMEEIQLKDGTGYWLPGASNVNGKWKEPQWEIFCMRGRNRIIIGDSQLKVNFYLNCCDESK